MPEATPKQEPALGACGQGRPTYVVGIGASAGGLNALEVFYDNLRAGTGMAFVVVQHLPPDFGAAAEYLKDPEGGPGNKLLDHLEDNLLVALRASPPRVGKTSESVVTRNLLVARRGEEMLVDLTVAPLFDDPTRSMHFFVSFEAARPGLAPAERPREEQGGDLDLRASYRDHVQKLETELQSARERLQNTVEELRSTNEKLHSVNEELHSVHSELARKNVELKQLNTDHENLLNSIDISGLKESELRLMDRNDELESRVDQRTRELQHEVQEQHAAEAPAAARRDHYLSILMKAPALIWRSNLSGGCDWFNDTWLDFTGRPLDDELGDGWAAGVHPEDLERCLAIYRTAFERRESFEMEYRLRRRDGEFRWINDIGCPNVGVDGEFAGFIGYCFDITERIRTGQQLKSLNEGLENRVRARTRDLEEANRNLENVCYSISHELRAPIARLEGFGAQLLESVEALRAPDLAHYAERIVTSTGKLKTVIDSVLLLNRLSRREMRRQRVDVSELCACMIDELKEEFNREASAAIQGGVVVEGDRDMLAICMRNLLANAFKYSAKTPGAQVSFGVQDGAAGRIYVVTDNGAGFDMAYADKLFRPFSRLHQESEFDGVGIGLAMAQQIAVRHGGRMWAESAAGAGSRFYLTLGESS